MKIKKNATLAILMAAAALASVSSWYLWAQGIIGHNPNAPSNENFMRALHVFHSNEDQRWQVEESGRCIFLPSILEKNYYEFTDLVPKQVPGQYVFNLDTDARSKTIQPEVKKILQALALAGFLNETTTPKGLQYQLTWAATPHLLLGTTQFCALYGRFGPINIIRTTKLESPPSQVVRYEVTYKSGLIEPSVWLEKPGVRAILQEILQNSKAVTGQEITKHLALSKDGWMVENAPYNPDKLDAKARATGNALGPLIEGYFKASSEDLEGMLEACLPLPYTLEDFRRKRVLPEHIAREYQDSYLTLDLMLNPTNSPGPEEAGTLRLIRRLVRHGVLVSEVADDANWQKSDSPFYKILGGTIYRVAPELKKYVVRRKDFDTDRINPRYCLQFATREIKIVQSKLRGYLARGNNAPSYEIAGRITPVALHDWIKPLLESKSIAEANAVADGIYFSGSVDYIDGKLRFGVMHVAHPISIASPYIGGSKRGLVNLIESRIRIASNILEHTAPKDFLAKDPSSINRFINELRENPNAIALARGQCNERKLILTELRAPLAELQEDEEYRPTGAMLAKVVQQKRAELEKYCEAMVRQFHEIFKQFPQLRNPTIDAQLRNDPPPTRTLIPNSSDIPKPAVAPTR